MQISLETPGLIHGIGIQQIDLVQMGHGASLATEVDTQVRALIGDMNAFNEALLAANASASQGLNAKASQAVTSMAVVGVVSTLLAGAFALWMSTIKITRPLVRMVERMRALAQGDLEVEIDGLDRGDEVGEMANAVQVFKTNAIERVRVEKEATEHRAEVETERRRVEAEKARAAETQTQAMSQLGDGLRRLAGGDLTSRLDQRFPTEFAKIRDDFNAAASKLMETVRAVVASTSAIHAGSHEISTSSDDLSRRTEQQAARLEEAAAALDEITATLKKSAEGAKQAAVEVASADGNAKKGAVVVKQAVEAMDAIAKSSEQIGQIIGVIDEIAFQTNLLALNAGRRGGARRRRRPRLRGGRLRSARARPAFGGGRQGDQEPDLDFVEPGRLRRPTRRRIRQGARPHHRPGVEDQRHRLRDRHQRRAAGDRPAAGQHGDQPDGRDDAEERDDGRGVQRRQPFAVAGDLATRQPGRAVPGRGPRRRGAQARVAQGRSARLRQTGGGRADQAGAGRSRQAGARRGEARARRADPQGGGRRRRRRGRRQGRVDRVLRLRREAANVGSENETGRSSAARRLCGVGAAARRGPAIRAGRAAICAGASAQSGEPLAMSLTSMTGFARAAGALGPWRWTVEIKCVNAKGLDLRLRLPPGFDRIEGEARARLGKALARGACFATISASREGAAAQARLDLAALDEIISAARAAAAKAGLAPPTMDGVLAVRGVVEVVEAVDDEASFAAVCAGALESLDAAIAALVAARRAEGAALQAILSERLDAIAG